MGLRFDSRMLRNDRKIRLKKFGFGSLLFFWTISAFLVGIGYLVQDSNSIDPDWYSVSGVVIDAKRSSGGRSSSSGRTYSAVVSYKVNGKNFEITASDGSSKFPKKGETRQVTYNPDQPVEAKVVANNSTKLFGTITPIVGVAIFIGSIIAFIRSIKRTKISKDLMQPENKRMGILTDIRRKPTNNEYYNLIVTATDLSGEVRNYVSDDLESVAGLAIADFATSTIPIDLYVDPANPDRYFVDIDSAPKLTPERIKELQKSVIEQTMPSIRSDDEKPCQL